MRSRARSRAQWPRSPRWRIAYAAWHESSRPARRYNCDSCSSIAGIRRLPPIRALVSSRCSPSPPGTGVRRGGRFSSPLKVRMGLAYKCEPYRFAMYIVISMPKRKSSAVGVSQVMMSSLGHRLRARGYGLQPERPVQRASHLNESQRKTLEPRLMIFMKAGRPPDTVAPATPPPCSSIALLCAKMLFHSGRSL